MLVPVASGGCVDVFVVECCLVLADTGTEFDIVTCPAHSDTTTVKTTETETHRQTDRQTDRHRLVWLCY